MPPRFQTSRLIGPEILDEQTPERAERSLRDLVRINRYFGGHEVTRSLLARFVAAEDEFSVLDVGAASGDTGRIIAARYPRAHVTSLDYKPHHLRRANSPKIAADAFRLPFAPGSFDFVHCSLFLHHFENADVTILLGAFARIARRAVLVNDLERRFLPYWFLPATRWLFRWDPITLHDGPVSVQAAFRATELRQLAVHAGLADIHVRVHRPSFRLSLSGRLL